MVLFVVGTIAISMSIGPLANLFEEYQDSTPGTYLLVGGVPLVIGIGCFALGFAMLFIRSK